MRTLPEGCSWVAGQKELCPATGREHWQLACHTTKKKTLHFMRNLFAGAHVEPSRSDAADAYVRKLETAVEGTFFEIGQRVMKMNSKIDWAKQLQLAKEGKEDEIDPSVYMRCYSTIKKIGVANASPPEDIPDVCGVWIYGAPGCGKSLHARTYANWYDKPCNKWWDNWKKSHETAILDDFDKCHRVLGHYLKRWTDRYSFNAEIKGGSVLIRPKNVVVTSNYTIEEIFGDDEVLVAALKRRFRVIHMLDRNLK